MQNGKIAEVRGISKDQELEPAMLNIVETQLDELPGGDAYRKKTADMRKVTELEVKQQNSENLNPEDLRFLYEINDKIEGFGYDRDPRIEEIRDKRDTREDISKVFNIAPNEVSLTTEEALAGSSFYHYENLDLYKITSAEGLQLPESIGGDLYLNGLTSAEGLHLPKKIGGYLNLASLTSAEGLQLPESVGYSIEFRRISKEEKDRLRHDYPHLKIE